MIAKESDRPSAVASLKDLLPASLVALGVSSEERPLAIWPSRHVVVLLIDGLGELQLTSHADAAPVLDSFARTVSLVTEFPSTTPVALGSLGTGMSPGSHGLIAANFWLPETESMLAPLKWGSDPHPLLVAPEQTYFEKAFERGITVTTIAQEKHRDSGLSRSVLRGSNYRGASTISEIAQAFEILQRELSKSTHRALTYVYWPDLDRIGHVCGVGSVEWLAGLREVDHLVSLLTELLHGENTLVVTADHGMITCTPEHHISIEANPILSYGIKGVGGEPRARHIYSQPGAVESVQANWRSELVNKARVYTREEVLDHQFYVVSDTDIAERIGDLVVMPHGDYTLTSIVDPRTSRLLGQHGGLTPAEMVIPFRQFAAT